MELKRLVTRREYFDLLLQRDPSAVTVTKKRYSFLYQENYFELDQFVSPHRGLYLLEFYAELDRDIAKMLPTFLRYEREVTNDPTYSMRALAQKPSEALQNGSGGSGAASSAAEGENPAAAFRKSGRSLSVTHTPTQTDAQGRIADEAHSLLGPPERQRSGQLELTHQLSSAPTSPHIQPARNTANVVAAVTEHKL